MAIQEIDARIGALRDYLNRRPPNTSSVFDFYDSAKILSINWQTFKVWVDRGYVKPLKGEELKHMIFSMSQVLKDLENHKLSHKSEPVSQSVQEHHLEDPQVPESPPVQISDPKSPLTFRSEPDLLARVRERAMKAAREAYRDEILEAADQAEKAGNPALANRFYKDFIHMEEGLKVIYESK